MFSFLFMTFSVFAQSNIENSDTFLKISKESYSLRIPSSWTLDTSKRFGMDLLLLSPKEDSLDDFRENLNIFVQDLSGQNYNLLRMGKESEVQIRETVNNLEIIENRLDSTASQQYYILKYKARQGKFSLIIIQRYYLKDEIGFALTFTIKEGKEVEYVPISERIFNSFKFE